jgi:hypothetical protein
MGCPVHRGEGREMQGKIACYTELDTMYLTYLSKVEEEEEGAFDLRFWREQGKEPLMNEHAAATTYTTT